MPGVRNSSIPVTNSGFSMNPLQIRFAHPTPLQTNPLSMSHLFVVGTLALREEMSKGMNSEEDGLEKKERKYEQTTLNTVY